MDAKKHNRLVDVVNSQKKEDAECLTIFPERWCGQPSILKIKVAVDLSYVTMEIVTERPTDEIVIKGWDVVKFNTIASNTYWVLAVPAKIEEPLAYEYDEQIGYFHDND